MNKIKILKVRWFLLILIIFSVTLLSACGATVREMVRDDDIAALKIELDKGLSVNARDEYRSPLLVSAAEYGNVAMVRDLLRRSADVNIVDGENQTPLHRASQVGNRSIVKALLSAGALINKAGEDGKLPIHEAATYGHDETVKLLIQHGSSVNGKTRSGKTPLHTASKRGHVNVLEVLLDNGADISATDKNAFSSLEIAIIFSKNEAVALLLNAGANPHKIRESSAKRKNLTPLHYAAVNNNQDAMKLLIQYGADPSVVNGNGHTPHYLLKQELKSLAKTRAEARSKSSDSSFDFGKVIAIAGGAALASSSNLSSVQKADFMTNYTKDVLTDSGGTNTRNWGNNGGSSSSDINDPLNSNNPINKRMSEQVKRNVGLHEQKQQQAKQEYAAQLKQRSQQINQQRAASLKNTSFTNNSQQQAVSHQPSSSAVTKSKYSGMSFAAKDDETEAKEPDKEKVETPPVALSKGEMFGDSEEYYYSKKSSMNIAQTHLQNNTAEFCGSSLKSRLSWHDSSTTCKEKNEQFRCKVYATATCFDKACDTFFCGTKR